MAVKNQIRQSSLILGTGPGALTVLQDGSTVMVPGIDAWYITRTAPFRQVIPDEAIIRDALLQKNLGVEFFVLPPAEGVSEQKDTDYVNATLFPSWLVCYSCKNLERMGQPQLTKCPRCDAGAKRKMVQTNFVIACEDGHLDEFPWVEWVHKGMANVCPSPQLLFKAKGVVQLGSQRVVCKCNASRSLSGTADAAEDGTTELSRTLEAGALFLCKGSMPWLGGQAAGCGKHVRMVLRSSNNIYFASTVSSILVPSEGTFQSDALDRIRSSNRKAVYQGLLMRQDFGTVAMILLATEHSHYAGITAEELESALRFEFPQGEQPEQFDPQQVSEFDRTPEWVALSSPREDRDLVVRSAGDFDRSQSSIEKIHAVPFLKKTTALKGFTRLKPRDISPAHGRQLLRRNPFAAHANWLPAIQQTGEGIFIALDQPKLDAWCQNSVVQQRAQLVAKNLSQNNREIPGVETTAKFLLLHTLAHILIQEVVIECGYTSASLAERIYPADGQAGILIYTAATSSDGTMGGLVEMAQPAFLLSALSNGLERASWCSNDPVCMEMGHSGQGNSGSNLAACHSCCLLPETACEYFNQGLDRALLIGDTTNRTELTGFFGV